MFISCSLNAAIVSQRLVDIALAVNCHHCTRKCEGKCKYGFPRFPLKETIVVDKNKFSNSKEDDAKEPNKNEPKNHHKMLADVEDVLTNKDIIEQIFNKYPHKGDTKEKYDEYRAKRIEEMLKMAGGITYDDYIMAIKKTRKHGSTVMLQRDIDEIFVNNYNPEWLMAWNANLDIQPVLDFFGVITYVTDYWAKPDEGLTPILREAAKILKSEPDQQKRCQQMANTFITNRQMGEAEAYYKILPNLTLKYSSVDTFFIPTDKKALRSKFLMKLAESDENLPNDAKVRGGKEGLFLEKPDIIDKFCRREITYKNEELGELSAIQFGKLYQPYNFKKSEKEQDDKNNKIDDTDFEMNYIDNEKEKNSKETNMNAWNDEEDRVANFYITANPNYNNIRLPEIIRLKDPFPGEVPFFKKKTFPKAVREDTDPHRFFLSELKLYTGYTDEQQLGCDDEEKCKENYLKKQNDILLVKRLMMPFTQGVEEARYYVQQAMENDKDKLNIGNDLDPELEKEILECDDEMEDLHPDFVQVNPDDFETEDNITQVKKTLRSIEIQTVDEMLEQARTLDEFQKKVLHIAIQFVQHLKIARKGKCPYPCAPLMMIHGGAGSGKSTVIKVMCQYIQHILKNEGDDPD